MYFTVDYTIPTNSDVVKVVYWIYDHDYDQFQDIDFDVSDLSGTKSIDLAFSIGRTYGIFLDLDKANYFDLISFTIPGMSACTNLGELPLFYGLEDSLSPTNGQSISTSNQISVSWAMPTNIGNIIKLILVIQNTNTKEYDNDYLITNLGATTNLTMDFPLTKGNPNSTNGYCYYIYFYSDKGIEAVTRDHYLVTH